MNIQPRARVLLFGYPVLRRGDREINLESAKVRALLAYLVHHTQLPQSRDYLAYLLWPDAPNDVARKNLRQALYSLRKALGPVADACLDIQRETVRLRPHPALWVDVWEFQRLLSETAGHTHRAYGACPYCHRRYAAIVELYRREFLHGFSVRDADPFEEWSAEQREYYHQKVLAIVHQVVRFHYLRGHYEQADRWAQRWLRWDPWSEAAYAYRIRALALQGRKGAALRVYQAYQRMMRDELGMEPSADAAQLIYDIRHDLLAEPASVRQQGLLPQPQTRLVGREREREALLLQLAQPTTRLVTIIGLGGLGKTRLAEAVAREALTLFPEGVYWVSLEGATSPDATWQALREALRPMVTVHAEPTALRRALQARRALLVLDGLTPDNEALLRWLQDLLRAGRDLVVLATARHPLRLRHEQRFPLRGLDYPAPYDEPPTPEQALRYPAVALFVERARQLRPEFRLTEANLEAVLRIARWTQGLPLALELAAGQVAHSRCAEIAQRLEGAALDVESPYRDQPPQHRSLRVLLESTWEHLDAGLQQALVRVAGFSGPFDTVLAQEVAQVSPQELNALVQHGLLQVQEAGEEAAAFWQLHTLTRAFALEQRAAHPTLEAAWRARVQAWLQHNLPAIGLERSEEMRRLHALRDDMSAYLEALATEGALEEVAAGLQGLAAWFRYQGRLQEGVAYAQRLLARLETFPPSPERSRTQGYVYRRLGLFHYLQGDLEQARAVLTQALDRLTPWADDEVEYARALQGLAGVLEMEGDLDAAMQHEQEALERFQAALTRANTPDAAPRDLWIDLANSLNNLGGIAFRRGDLAQAEAYYRQAVTYYRRYGGQTFLVNTLGNLAHVLLSHERLAEAQEMAEEALRLAQHGGAPRSRAHILGTLGTIAIHREDLTTAQRRLRQAVQLARRLQLPELLVTHSTNLAITLQNLRQAAAAESAFREAIHEAQSHGLRYHECSASVFFAAFLLGEERLAEAARWLGHGLHLARQHAYQELYHKALVYTVALGAQSGRRAPALALVRWLQSQPLDTANRRTLDELVRAFFRKPARGVQQQAQALQATAEPQAWARDILQAVGTA